MASKKITIDNLAEMIGKGFAGVDKRFDDVDKRFDEVDKGLDKIENVLIRQHSDKISNLESEIRRIKEALVIK